ncbi:MAG: anthranilate synthase component I family protein [Bacteroidia bacterium]|nr:anthranilate synthase component I family protein [Bacteroidia bacterium]
MDSQKLSQLVQGLWNQPSDFALLLSNSSGHNFPVENEFLLGVSDDNSPASKWPESNGAWHFGWVPYDYKNKVEPSLFSSNPSFLPYSEHPVFFEAKSVYFTLESAWSAYGQNNSESFSEPTEISIHPGVDLNRFLEILHELKLHIKAGNIYEINYCIPSDGSYKNVDWANLFIRLNALAQAPFSVFSRIGNTLIISLSPERFFKRVGQDIWVQPMKGTAPRSQNRQADQSLISELKTNEKERAENCMIVDLTRNDLSKICFPGSVKVNELCGVYTFPNVHQMVSTVQGRLMENYTPENLFKSLFPMGSMTGAPKVKAMELIEQYECFARGPFSGSFGYVGPTGECDFNVLIRSIFVNLTEQKFFYATGSAITINSDPEKEWEEVQLKAGILQQLAIP